MVRSCSAAVLQWYRLDWNITQVIVIARLHAMYRRSMKVLGFLVITLTAVTVAAGVDVVKGSNGISGGMLRSWIKDSYPDTTNTRGIRGLQQPHVLFKHYWRLRKTDDWDLDIWHWMGNSRTVSRLLGCCKALPWTATITNRMDRWGLFHDVNKNTYPLLHSVSSHLKSVYYFPLRVWTHSC
jgi:hypothetical protein